MMVLFNIVPPTGITRANSAPSSPQCDVVLLCIAVTGGSIVLTDWNTIQNELNWVEEF
jgi:hypothetical protein